MSEPGLLPSAAAARPESLWEKAPAWRGLVVTASLLTLAAVAVPLALPPKTESAAPAKIAAGAHVPILPAVTPPVTQAMAPAHLAMLQPKAEAAPPQTAPSCPLPANTAPRHLGTAIVVGFISQQQSLQVFRQKTTNRGAPVNPAYLDYVRLLIHPEGAPDGVTRGTLAPPGANIAVGDRVTFDSAYRDPGGACMWIPTLVAADLGPAKTPLPAQPAQLP